MGTKLWDIAKGYRIKKETNTKGLTYYTPEWTEFKEDKNGNIIWYAILYPVKWVDTWEDAEKAIQDDVVLRKNSTYDVYEFDEWGKPLYEEKRKDESNVIPLR